MNQTKGKIIQVIGPVVDVIFEKEGSKLPSIYDALEVIRKENNNLIIECQQHIGENTIRCVAMDSTDGLTRGMEVNPTGKPITMPSGESALGRLVNVVGDSIDGLEALPKNGGPIHKDPPKYEDLLTNTEILFTGIKVIDLIEPYAKGG
ncbi:MAG: F0F1 ATP synthase subunit beta, partial [Tangfeifania sp.]